MAIRTRARNKDSEYAEEGTRAHALAAAILVSGKPAIEFSGVGFEFLSAGAWIKFEPPDDMLKFLQEYVDYCHRIAGARFVETKTLFQFIPLPEQFGTADFVCIYYDPVLDCEVLVVIDLKYGQGEIVFAHENEQALAYALGFYLEYKDLFNIQKVVIAIAQPRLQHWDEWETTPERLMRFKDEFIDIVKQAMLPNPPMEAGRKQCLFCPNAGNCSVQTKAVHDTMLTDFDDFDTGEARNLTDAELTHAIEMRGLVKKWVTQVTVRAMEAIQSGRDIGGWKIVESRTHRKYKSERRAKTFLTDAGLPLAAVVEESLISVAQAEKLLKGAKKKEFAAYYLSPPGKPTLAPVDDKREAFVPGVHEFDSFDLSTDDGLGD